MVPERTGLSWLPQAPGPIGDGAGELHNGMRQLVAVAQFFHLVDGSGMGKPLCPKFANPQAPKSCNLHPQIPNP